MDRNPMRAVDGFALLEVVTALAILSIGIVAVLAGLRSSTRLVRASENLHGATIVLEAELKRIAADPSSALDSGDPDSDSKYRTTVDTEPLDVVDGGIFDALGIVNTGHGTRRGRGTEDEDTATALDDLRLIRVTVEWDETGTVRRIQGSQLVRDTALHVGGGH